MKKKLLIISAAVIAIPMALYLIWSLYLYFYMKQFEIMDTQLNRQTVMEWKKAPQEEKISTCAIMLAPMLKKDDFLSESIKKAIHNPKTYKYYSTLCAEYIDEYIELSHASDTTRVSWAFTMAIAANDWTETVLPDEMNPFKKQKAPSD